MATRERELPNRTTRGKRMRAVMDEEEAEVRRCAHLCSASALPRVNAGVYH